MRYSIVFLYFITPLPKQKTDQKKDKDDTNLDMFSLLLKK
jgi:hypothetical protein